MHGLVSELWCYPVKSAQGERVDAIDIAVDGVVGDRQWALLDERGKLCSAKRFSALLDAQGRSDGSLVLHDGRVLHDDGAISAWLGHAVRLVERSPDVAVAYEMTFDPPNDDAELFEIPAPPGSFLDLAPIHLISTATLRHCATARPDLDWDVRRFRPNVVVDLGPDAEPFAEDTLAGSELHLGAVALRVDLPTVRCAMPLRGQPGLDRQPDLYRALEDLHANHLGVYASVVRAGVVRVGDAVGT